MGWIVNEDAALKFLLQGIRVTDPNAPPAGRLVPAYYDLPETEVQDFTPPCIIIKHLGWFRDPSREHSGYTQIPYAPEGYQPWWPDSGGVNPAGDSFDPKMSPYRSYVPVAYNFDYQVTVFTRLMHEHMVPIVATLAQMGKLHPHWGYLPVPQDGTTRTLLLNGGPDGPVITYGNDQDDKHLLSTTYNVRVCSELLGPIDAPVVYGGSLALATQLKVNMGVYLNPADLTTEELQRNWGIVSTGMSSTWNTLGRTT